MTEPLGPLPEEDKRSIYLLVCEVLYAGRRLQKNVEKLYGLEVALEKAVR